MIGSVYNGDNKHPYKLPDNKTQSGIKSNSSKGGNGYNEYMFEDKKGSELIRMHAQKDYDVTVHHVETRKIGEDGVSGASRDTTLLTGDDKLTIATGSQNIMIAQMPHRNDRSRAHNHNRYLPHHGRSDATRSP